MANSRTYKPKNFSVFVSCMAITSCFSDRDINIDRIIITTVSCVIITLHS